MVSFGSRFGRIVALALFGAGVAAACGDGEDTLYEPGGSGAGGTAGSTGATAGNGGDGASTSPGGGGSDEGGTAGAAAAGSGGTESGDAGGAGDAGSGGGSGGGVLAPSCERAKGDVPKLKLSQVTSVADPVQLVSPPGDPRLFVVSRRGSISVFKAGRLLDAPFLSLDVDAHYAELGLLGLAFHPDYAENGLFYVHYIAPRVGDAQGDLVIAEYRVSGNPDRANDEPVREFFRLPQPTQKHKAGSMAFDSHGLLYLAVGNGGEIPWSGDTTQFQGKILRIDPAPGEDSYRVPSNNPKLAGWEPEILETGLRNPWRIALDPCTDDLYIGDVGNQTAEEINISPADDRGHDFGFPTLEGDVLQCDDCSADGTTLPVAKYGHDKGCAMIGGVVYRGGRIPALRGTYFYSDLCRGFFRSFRYERGAISDERDLTDDLNPDEIESITSFGNDASGEVYVLSRGTNRVYRIDAE